MGKAVRKLFRRGGVNIIYITTVYGGEQGRLFNRLSVYVCLVNGQFNAEISHFSMFTK